MKKYFQTVISICILMSVSSCLPGDMIINGNVISQKEFQAQKLVANSLYVQSMIQDDFICSAQNVFSEQIITNKLTVSKILVTNEKGILELNGDITIQSLEVEETLELASFLQTNEWQLVYHDHFEDKKSLVGWNINQVQICSKQNNHAEKMVDDDSEHDNDYFLAGHCVGPSDLKLHKEYTELPKHKNIKIQARVHFFDQWEGESLTLYVDDKIAWTKVIEGSDSQVDVCGGSSADPHFGMPIDITIPHKLSQVHLRFESNLTKDRCVASFAIDDVEIFVK